MPRLPDEYLVRFTDTPHGRLRCRVLGRPRAGVPPVVVVMGMAVSDYLLPAVASLGSWTRAYLVELPGLGGSGEPRHRMDAHEHARAVAAWLDAADLPPAIIAGHSSGTQVAAEVALRRPASVAGLVLAAPTVDPSVRSLARVFIAWRRDSRYPLPGLQRVHIPQWRRAGLRRVYHLVRAYVRGPYLEDLVPHVEVPVLVIRGESDGISTASWARHLAGLAPDGRFLAVPGPHTFVWPYPDSWTAPIQEMAGASASRAAANRRDIGSGTG